MCPPSKSPPRSDPISRARPRLPSRAARCPSTSAHTAGGVLRRPAQGTPRASFETPASRDRTSRGLSSARTRWHPIRRGARGASRARLGRRGWISHQLNRGHGPGLEVPIHERRVHLDSSIHPHPRARAGVETGIVLHHHDGLDHGVERTAPAFENRETSLSRRLCGILHGGVGAGATMCEEEWAHSSPHTGGPFQRFLVGASPLGRVLPGPQSVNRRVVGDRLGWHAAAPWCCPWPRGPASPRSSPQFPGDNGRGNRR